MLCGTDKHRRDGDACCATHEMRRSTDERRCDSTRAALQAAPEYDTFGSTAAEVARRAAETDAAGRTAGALPNLMPDELLAPVADSMGVRLRHATYAVVGGLTSPSLALPSLVPRVLDRCLCIFNQAFRAEQHAC